MLADRVQAGFEQVHVVDAGDFHRILKRQEHAFARAFFRRQRQQVFAFVCNGAGGDFIALATGEHLRERALARAVRAHDGVHLADPDFEIQTVQHLLVAGACVKILDA
jgi:hypothetical protein